MFVVFYLFFTRVPFFIKFVFTVMKFCTWVNKKSKLELRVIIERRLYARYMTDFSLDQTVQLKFIVLRLKMDENYLIFLVESFTKRRKFDKNGDGIIFTKDLGNN